MKARVFLLAVVMASAGCAAREPSVRALRAPRQGLTHPILDIDPDHEFREYRPFRHRVVALIEERRKKGDLQEASVYFRDLDNGPIVGVNESAPFRPASLLKLPIMIGYLKARETDPTVLRRRLALRPPPLRPTRPAFPPSQALVPGSEYAVDELLTAMIARSDNDAAHTLIADMREQDYLQVYSDLGLRIPNTRDIDDPISVRAYASFFRILYNSSYLDRAMSERALRYLAASEFTGGLRAGVPAGLTVAHKFGESDDGKGLLQLHDCGIVYHPRDPYLLCVMTKGRDMARLAAFIAGVSALVYRRVDGVPATR